MVRDIYKSDSTARRLINADSQDNKEVNVFRFKQSQDDSTMLFWRPFDLEEKEWPFIFFLKLVDGKLFPNKDLGPSV